MSATKFTPEMRGKIAALLEKYGGTWEAFDQIKSNSYEQAIASFSLEHLEQLYAEIFAPGQNLAQAAEKCPPWPPGTERAGQLPGTTTLSQIATRIRTESRCLGLERVSAFMDRIEKRAAPLAVGQGGRVVNAIVTMMGEELIESKLAGQTISSNLPTVDRLLIAESAKTRAQQEEVKIGIRQEAEARMQKTEARMRQEFEFDAAKACLAHLPELKTIAANQTLTDFDRLDAVRRRLFGSLPEDQKPSP